MLGWILLTAAGVLFLVLWVRATIDVFGRADLSGSAKAASPDDPDVDDTLGWVYYKRGLSALAVEPLRRSIAKDPKNALYHFHLGMVYVKNGDAANAKTMLQRAVSLGLESQDESQAQRALASLRG